MNIYKRKSQKKDWTFLQVFFVAVFINLLLSASGFSHPHAWIIYEILPKQDKSGNILGIEETWTFDPYYSVFLLEEQKKLGKASEYEKRLQNLGSFMLNNMAKFSYFTVLKGAEAKKAKFIYLKDIRSRMQMRFYLPFKNKIGKNAKFEYKIFDPTYYIDMQHKEKHKLKFSTCSLDIKKSNPGQDIINQALALDKMDTPQSNLGILFTDTGIIKCQ